MITGSSESTQGIELRSLATQADFDQCVELQRDIWGPDFAEVVPPALLQVTQKVGGIAAGAFDSRGRLVGFVYGVTGVRDGRVVHWSHMLAVTREWEGRGLGTRLKGYQRDKLLELGIGTAMWTFDPLVARNAHFNLNRLAASVTQYVPDMYGDTGSELHRLGTDRFLLEWDLASDAVAAALSGGRAPSRSVSANAPVAGLDRAGLPMADAGPCPADPTVMIPIPRDIDVVKAGSPELGRSWRAMTRRTFLWYLERGYRVLSFDSAGSGDLCYYGLAREPDEG